MVVPNVRGSSGYGPKREESVRDISALLDWIDKQPDLAATQMGVYGSSYGAYMCLATM